MGKDTTAFKKRFNAYKNGKSISEIYDAGLPKYADGKDDALFEAFQSTLPYNLRNTPEFMYPTRRYWELNGKPKDFAEAIGKGMYTYDTSDNYWHANSVQYNESTGEYEFMKPNWHDTKMMEDAWYYSKDGEDFRNSYIKQPGIIYDKYIPKAANNDGRVHIGFKDGKLPHYNKGKGDGTRYLWDDLEGEWDRITNDELARIFADLTVTPKGNRDDNRTNPVYHDPRLKNAGYVTKTMLEDEANSKKQKETAIYAPGLELVNPEFDLLLFGDPLRFNPLTLTLWKNRSLAKEINKVVDEGLLGATKDMPVLKPLDMYNPEHMLSTVKYNPKQIDRVATVDNAMSSDIAKLIEKSILPIKRFEGVPEADYTGPIPQTSVKIGSTDRPWLRLTPAGRRFGFADPYADLTTASAGQEVASPELASTLYPRNRYTVQDVPSRLVTRYTEMPNPRTGYSAESIVNSLYDSYVKALKGYGKYGLKPPTPYIPNVGDDFVDAGFISLFYDMAHLPSAVEGVKNMPKGITEKTGVKMLQDLPHAQYEFLQKLPPTAFDDHSLLRGTGLEFTNRGLRRIGEPVNELLLPTWAGTDTDIDDPFGLFAAEDGNALLERAAAVLPTTAGEAPFPPQMDIDEYERFREIYERFIDREKFRINLSGFGSKLLSPRYSKILSHAEDPDKYITDNFGKQILRNAREDYFSSIKKLKLKDYARRVKKAERLNLNDTRFEIADDNRDKLQDAIAPGKSFNASIKDALELQNVINALGNWAQDASKDWILMQADPNRPGWMLKSLMLGNPLEKQLSKDGMISTTNILNHIKKGSDIEKYVVDKVLNGKFAGQSKINYADFKHAVQDELISYRHEPDSGYESYGMDRIGRHRSWDNDLAVETYTFTSPRLPFGNAKHYHGNTLGHSRTFTDTLNEPDVLYVMESLSDWALNYEENSWIDQDRYDNLVKNIKYLEDELSKLSPQERSRDASRQDGMTASLRKMKENIQGAKSAIDRAPHERYLTTNFERRQIQENLLNAARHGLSKMRYPTADTAALIEGYPKMGGDYWQVAVSRLQNETPYTNHIDDLERLLEATEMQYKNEPDLQKRLDKILKEITRAKAIEERWRNGEITYDPSHETILAKYRQFPKLYKKLYKDAEVRTITDSKGRTWYEVDVPKNLRRKELMYGIGATVAAGGATLKPKQNK